jgi:hypothetical protein
MAIRYSLSTNPEWRIDEDEIGDGWTLKVHRGGRWERVELFSSPEEAANAVRGSKTGVIEWDQIQRTFSPDRYELPAWKKSNI